MRFGAARVANAAAWCVLGVADESQCQDLAPKLARLGARICLCKACSTNPSSSMVNGVPVDGLMSRGQPRCAAIDEISSSFDFECCFKTE